MEVLLAGRFWLLVGGIALGFLVAITALAGVWAIVGEHANPITHVPPSRFHFFRWAVLAVASTTLALFAGAWAFGL